LTDETTTAADEALSYQERLAKRTLERWEEDRPNPMVWLAAGILIGAYLALMLRGSD
jgi:hypothetical protein